jgi:hypothetical protein
MVLVSEATKLIICNSASLAEIQCLWDYSSKIWKLEGK